MHFLVLEFFEEVFQLLALRPILFDIQEFKYMSTALDLIL